MSDQENMISNCESKIQLLEQETNQLNSKIKCMQRETEEISRQLEHHFLKQIEVLTVFVVIVSLIITNVLGIDALSNYGLKGLVALNFAFVISVTFLLLAVKFIIIGFKKRS